MLTSSKANFFPPNNLKNFKYLPSMWKIVSLSGMQLFSFKTRRYCLGISFCFIHFFILPTFFFLSLNKIAIHFQKCIPLKFTIIFSEKGATKSVILDPCFSSEKYHLSVIKISQWPVLFSGTCFVQALPYFPVAKSSSTIFAYHATLNVRFVWISAYIVWVFNFMICKIKSSL